MAPIDRSCSNVTLHPNMYIEKFNISWLSLCITDVAASVKRLDNYTLWGHRDQFTWELLYRSVLVLPVLQMTSGGCQQDPRPQAKSENIELFNVELTL